MGLDSGPWALTVGLAGRNAGAETHQAGTWLQAQITDSCTQGNILESAVPVQQGAVTSITVRFCGGRPSEGRVSAKRVFDRGPWDDSRWASTVRGWTKCRRRDLPGTWVQADHYGQLHRRTRFRKERLRCRNGAVRGVVHCEQRHRFRSGGAMFTGHDGWLVPGPHAGVQRAGPATPRTCPQMQAAASVR